MDKQKKDYIKEIKEDDLEATASFKDIMSKKEYKKYLKQKEKELEKTDKFNFNDDEKLEITSSFDEILGKKEKEEDIDTSFLDKKEKKKNKKEKKKKEKIKSNEDIIDPTISKEITEGLDIDKTEEIEIDKLPDNLVKEDNKLSDKHFLKKDNFDTATNIKILEKPKHIDDLSKPKEDIDLKSNKEIPIKKENNDKFLTVILALIFLGGLAFLAYSALFNGDDARQIYQMINSGSVSALALLVLLTIKCSKKGLKRFLQFITTLALVVYIIATILITLDILKVPTKSIVGNFINKNVTSAMKWANKNDVDLNVEYDFSDKVDKNLIISQDVDPNTVASKVDNMNIIVSDGPNYDLKIDLPDMIGWNVDEVIEKIDELKMNNIDIDFEFNEDVERDILYEQSQKGKMTRNNKVDLKFSLGNESELQPVNLKDLKNMSEFKATLWLKRNGIKYEISYEYSDDIEYGHVISTDPVKGTTINQKTDKVKIIISKGKKIKVPDFSKMTFEEIISWANQYRLKVTYDSEYDDSIKKGKVKRSNVKFGDIIDQGKEIHIILSKGKLKMISYSDSDITKIKKFADKNKIAIEIIEEFSNSIADGKIIKASHKPGDIIKNSDTIKITVSKGKATKIPNFIGMSVNEAKQRCSSNNLVCSYEYAYSDETKDTIIYQTKASGQQVAEGSGIVLTVSKGEAPEGEENYIAPTAKPKNNTKPSSSSSSTPTNCKEGQLLFNAGQTGSDTYAIMKQAASKIGATIKVTYKTACSNGDTTNGSVCPESQVNFGSVINSCKTYTAVIVNRN